MFIKTKLFNLEGFYEKISCKRFIIANIIHENDTAIHKKNINVSYNKIKNI